MAGPATSVPAFPACQRARGCGCSPSRRRWTALAGLLTLLACGRCFLIPVAWPGTLATRGGGNRGVLRGSRIPMAQEGHSFSLGDIVEAVYPDDGEFYAGKIEKDNGDGTFEVRWEDSDGGPETSPVKVEDLKMPRTPLSELEIGAKKQGIVRGSREFGIFVDINAERDGLVHVSKLPAASSGPLEAGETVEARDPEDGQFYPCTIEKDNGDQTFEVKWEDPGEGPESAACKAADIRRPKQVFEIDEEVEVYVERVTPDGRLSLSMTAPPPPADFSEFEGLHPEEWLDGRVVSVKNFGCFVSVKPPSGGAEQQGLVHVSQVRDGFVDDIFSEVQEGQQVKVRVLSVDHERGRLGFSMKSLAEGYDE